MMRAAAKQLRRLLEELGPPSFIKTTGSRAVHVVVPIESRADDRVPEGEVGGRVLVSAPITWEELDARELTPQRYTMRNVFRLLARRPDPWASTYRQARGLKEAAGRL